MSKKKKKRAVDKASNTADSRTEPMNVRVKAADGYTNLPASLGEASELQSAGTYKSNPITGDYELLTTLYRENWIAARIINMPSEDMTRAWYSLSTQLEQSKLDELRRLEARHSIKQEITNAIRWGRLYGGALALIVVKGQEDMLDQPLDFGMIMPGSFAGLLVVDMVSGIEVSADDLEDDMDDPDFGLPRYYTITVDRETGRTEKVHHSRLMRFVGVELPPQEEQNESYWGASALEPVYEELQKRNATSANIAQLVFQANTRVLKMADYGEVIAMGTAKQQEQVLSAIEKQNRLLTSFGVQLMGAEDNLESHPYTFSGISEIYEAFMMDMAGAANIPATRLFGRSPQGMNATGESDLKQYYESIAQLQETQLRPAIEKLLPVMAMSLWGAVPDDMEIVFEPIMTTTPSERAEIAAKFTSTVIDAFSNGLISQRTALKELRENGKEIGAWSKITDEDIEKASDEIDQGEMENGEMGEMEEMGESGMMPEKPEKAVPEKETAEKAAPEKNENAAKAVPNPVRKQKTGEPEHAGEEQPSGDSAIIEAERAEKAPEMTVYPDENEIVEAARRNVIMSADSLNRTRTKWSAKYATYEAQKQKDAREHEAMMNGKAVEHCTVARRGFFMAKPEEVARRAVEAVAAGRYVTSRRTDGKTWLMVRFDAPVAVVYEDNRAVRSAWVAVTWSREEGMICVPTGRIPARTVGGEAASA